MWCSGTNKGACLFTAIKQTFVTHTKNDSEKDLLRFVISKLETTKPWLRVGEKVSCCLFVGCCGFFCTVLEVYPWERTKHFCPHHNSSCLACSHSLSSSTLSFSSLAVITPSLFRSWFWNMSVTTCSMVSPGFMRPLPSATCSLMNSAN